ncbi:HAMP domain-containing sensor histidine kinase [Streptomyces sp. 549]|uniref:HAMP domain-containing sensor histidine kinase n=1 Tax=Streptomyces sp. 549 TaxID=3049076 RepID=UPI0024C27743|nr:HAMP domain-containing sensor histidine kinase [Streptomyces sp. 549]MDK1474945.1 HAMP domain-containing sensor histidine kinase [Streptomyces sp. 549]
MGTSRIRGGRRSWSLRTRLAVSAVTLVAVVAAVIGTVTALALHSYLENQLDGRLTDLARRAAGPPGGVLPPGVPGGADPLGFVTAGGQRVGTLGAETSGGDVAEGVVSQEADGTAAGTGTTAVPLDSAQLRALDAVANDGQPHTASLPELGDYRVVTVQTDDGGTVLVGLPLAEVQDIVGTLVVAELCVAGAGLLAAGIAAAAIVRIALRPLHRVAATATRVSELPLHQGEVSLRDRVPEEDTDPRTEVGQVGAALNRMLGHVESALAARQQSETRVRQFVADAGHELRTPLASIRGYAELTRRGPEDTGPDTRYALGRIESESVRMTGLVEDLLLLARLDTGRPLERTATDLVPLVVDAVSDARAAGGDHGWRLALPDAPVRVVGDPDRLRQVLVNLLANARTHTPPDTTVTVRVDADTDGWVLMEVADDGPGIPPDLLPHVFERFARGDASRTRATRPTAGTHRTGSTGSTGTSSGSSGSSGSTGSTGSSGSTGLGLAIVQAVVTAHGGAARVRSVPGRTVFTVQLPAGGPGSQVGHRPLPQE